MIKLALSLALLASPAWPQVAQYQDFSGGLNTRQSSILLQDNESPSLQNVVLDETGSITRRKGYSKLNSSAIGGGSSDVNAVYELQTSGGTKYCVAFSSTTGYVSTDGCATFTAFVSTLTRNNDVNCDAYNNNLYCVNNQYNFRFDGTNDINVPGMPGNLDFIRVFRNRCFATGNDSNPSRLFWSNLGDCNTWTTATDYVDIDAEDGDINTGLGPSLFNYLPVYKKYSIHLLQFDNNNTANRKIIDVSSVIGAKNHRAVANYNNRQYFDSVGPRGGQGGIYVTDGIMAQEISGKIRSDLESLGSFGAANGRKNVDTKAEWDAGTFDARALSSLRATGFMQSSYTSYTDTLGTDFAQGTLSATLSTKATNGALTIASAAYHIANGGFETGDNTSWTCTVAGAGQCTAGAAQAIVGSYGGQCTYAALPTANKTASMSLINLQNAAVYTITYPLILSVGSTAPSGCSDITTGECIIDLTANSLSTQTLKIKFTADADSLSSLGACTLTSSTFTAISSVSWHSVTTFGGEWTKLDEVQVNRYFEVDQSSHVPTFTSQIFNMYISTPIWGTFDTTTSSPASTGLSFKVQASTAGDGGGFESLVAQSTGAQIVAGNHKPYLRYEVTFITAVGTMTPTLYDVTVAAASTGTWTSPELFLSNTISSWGQFQTEQTTTGNGASITYLIKSSTTAGGAAGQAPVTLTPGSAITASTGAYIVIIATWTVAIGTEIAKTDVMTINWNEGTVARSATMAVYKNRLHYCAQSATSTYNDVCYVLDTRDAWYKWTGINARHLNLINQNFVIGGSTESSGGFLYKMYDTDSDAGNAINAFWESKDLALSKVQNAKAIDRLYLVHKNNPTTLTFDLKADTGLRSRSFSLNLSTGATFGIINKTIDSSLNGNTFRVKFGNNAASSPWEVQGFGLLYRDLGLLP